MRIISLLISAALFLLECSGYLISGTETDTGTITGLVVNEQQQVVTGAQVILRTAAENRLPHETAKRICMTHTSADGSFTFTSVTSGKYYIEINDHDTTGSLVSISVAATDHSSNVDTMTTHRFGAICGSIDTVLLPAVSASVYIPELDRTMPVASDGRFMVAGVPEYAYTIRLVEITTASTVLIAATHVHVVKSDTTRIEDLGAPAGSRTTIRFKPDAVSGKDAYIRDLTPDRNDGDHSDINAMAWTNSSTAVVVRSVLHFDLSAIPAGTTIKEAYLSLYNNPASLNNNGKHSSMNGPNTGLLQRITTPWEEGTVTWNNQPSTTSVNQVTLPESSNDNLDYKEIDVTGLVRDMIENPAQSFGFMIRLQTESHYRCLIFASSDHEDTSLHPELVITY